MFGVAVGMAVPLVNPWLRGTDGGWTQPSLCCLQVNANNKRSMTGLIGPRQAAVVPSGGAAAGGLDLTASAGARIVYGISGRNYKFLRYKSSVSGTAESPDNAHWVTDWTVTSDVYSYNCRQHGTARNPTTDCGTGTQQHTAGLTTVPQATGAFSVTVPLTYFARSVDSRGRPLTTPRVRSTGHWTVTAQQQYHGWLWTVAWSINQIAAGHTAGSCYLGTNAVVVTDGPFI